MNHRNFLRRRREYEEKVTATANHHRVDRAAVESRIRTAEKCTGQLLRCCFAAVEALQTTDVHLLTRYVASILAHAQLEAFGGGGGDADKFQETQVLYYCQSLYARHLAALQEDQVMELARDEGVFARLAHVLHKHGAAIEAEALDAGLIALSGMCATEYFSIHKKEMILVDGAYDTKASLRAIREERMGKYEGVDPAERKKVQALIDCVTTMERAERAAARPARPRIQSGRALADRIKMLSGG